MAERYRQEHPLRSGVSDADASRARPESVVAAPADDAALAPPERASLRARSAPEPPLSGAGTVTPRRERQLATRAENRQEHQLRSGVSDADASRARPESVGAAPADDAALAPP